MFRQRSQEDAEQPARQVSVAEVVEKGDRLHSGGGDQEEVAWEKKGMDPHLLLQRNKEQIKTVLVPHSEADTKMKPKDNILEMHKACEIKTAINVSLYQTDTSTDAFIDLLIRNLLIHDLLIIDASI